MALNREIMSHLWCFFFFLSEIVSPHSDVSVRNTVRMMKMIKLRTHQSHYNSLQGQHDYLLSKFYENPPNNKKKKKLNLKNFISLKTSNPINLMVVHEGITKVIRIHRLL